MNDEQITAVAREYAEEKCGKENASPMYFSREKNEMEEKLRWLSRRYCLVEKSKVTDLCRLTLEHGSSVDYGLIDGLTDIVCDIFSEQYHQVAYRLDNPEIAKEPNEILTSSDKLTLGKQDDSTKPTESKSMQLSDVKAKIDAWMVDHTDEEVYEALKKYGAIEDVEEAMIQGWVARDMNGDLVCCAGSKPFKEEKMPFWRVDFRNFIECIPNDLFPDLTWDNDPIEVELIIKRKKK